MFADRTYLAIWSGEHLPYFTHLPIELTVTNNSLLWDDIHKREQYVPTFLVESNAKGGVLVSAFSKPTNMFSVVKTSILLLPKSDFKGWIYISVLPLLMLSLHT